MAEPTVREKVYEAMILNIATDLDLESTSLLDITNKIFALRHPWIDVDGVKKMPEGDWIVLMADGKYGTCEVVHAKNGVFAVINGRFYFDYEPVVAYMAMPEYIPKGGGD